MNLIPRSEVSTLRMAAGNEQKYSTVIDGDDVKEWVGIGWITTRTATDDRKTYPTLEQQS